MAAVSFSLSNELDEFYLYFDSVVDEKGERLPAVRTLLPRLMATFTSTTERIFGRACHSGIYFRKAPSSCHGL